MTGCYNFRQIIYLILILQINAEFSELNSAVNK